MEKPAKPKVSRKRKTAKKRVGRPAHKPTALMRKQVSMLAAFGNSQPQICALLRVTPPTLRKWYGEEFREGLARANNAVAANLFKQATKDDPKAFLAAKYWLETRAGWSVYKAPQPTMRDPARPVKPEKMGKKELADIAAETAATGTGWESLVKH